MDYTEQQQFLKRSRLGAAGFILALLIMALACAEAGRGLTGREAIIFALVTIALAVFLYYTPDYLHLSINPQKRARWAVRVRWRIVAAVLVLGLLTASSNRSRVIVLIAVAWLALFNALRREMGKPYFSAWLWIGDFVLVVALLLMSPMSLFLGALLLAAAAHLAMVASDSWSLAEAGSVIAFSLLLIVFSVRQRQGDVVQGLLCAGLLLVTAAATMWLIRHAETQNVKNVLSAMTELNEFTGYSHGRIRELWATSDQQLAKNWQSSAMDEGDSERLAEWYRQNSELYLFAISGYNLEYKRIRSNLKVLSLGAGSCLDYGAGNGEIVLELAHRGHPVAYYDVQGETMRFARWRAARRNLAVEFFTSKEELLASRRSRGFDTIFSLDVLEHLPDLPGELHFLSSLLNPNGRMIFDVPAGATKTHPMHLNHNLNVVAHLKAKGLKDERNLWQRLPFRKEEKYIFRSVRHSSGSD